MLNSVLIGGRGGGEDFDEEKSFQQLRAS